MSEQEGGTQQDLGLKGGPPSLGCFSLQFTLAEMAKDKPRLCAALEMASAAIAKVSCGFGGPLSP